MPYARYVGPRRGDAGKETLFLYVTLPRRWDAAYAGRMLVAQDWKDSEPGYFDFIF